MMNFFDFPLDVTKRFRLNCLSCWRLRSEMWKHPICSAQWREPLLSWRDLPSWKTEAPFVMSFLSSSSVSPVLDCASRVSPWRPMKTCLHSDLTRQGWADLPSAFCQQNAWMSAAVVVLLQKGVLRKQGPGETPGGLCVAADVHTYHPISILGLMGSQALSLVEEKKNPHCAVGFVKSSII